MVVLWCRWRWLFEERFHTSHFVLLVSLIIHLRKYWSSTGSFSLYMKVFLGSNVVVLGLSFIWKDGNGCYFRASNIRRIHTYLVDINLRTHQSFLQLERNLIIIPEFSGMLSRWLPSETRFRKLLVNLARLRVIKNDFDKAIWWTTFNTWQFTTNL